MKPMEQLVRSYIEAQPESAARAFDVLDAAEGAKILAKLPTDAVAVLLEKLAAHTAGAMLQHLPEEFSGRVIEAMTPRQASVLLRNLEDARREEVLTRLPEKAGRALRDMLRYPPETAGGMMVPHVTAIPMDLTAQGATALLRKAPRETVFYLYGVDREGKLVGVLSLRDLLLASPKDPIAPLLNREIMAVPATMDREEVVALMRHRRFVALPVVDADGRLIGVVKPEEMRQAVEEEAFEDLQRLVGAGADEHAMEPVSKVIRRRLPWLYVNLGTAFLASSVVGLFSDILHRFPALAVLLPIVSGQGGNSGAQSLAVVIRGLALREIPPGGSLRVVVKEGIAGLLNGLAVAVVTAGAIRLWSGNDGMALVIGLAMIVNMLAAGVAGAAIPVVLRALGRDPAQSSSIFLTTVTDVVGFAAFLGFALIFAPLLGPER